MKQSLVTLFALAAALPAQAAVDYAVPTSFSWTLKQANRKVATGTGPEINCWSKAAADATARAASAVYNCTFVASASLRYIAPTPAPSPSPTPSPSPSPSPTPAPPPPITIDAAWPYAALEGASFVVVGTQNTRYGANNVWVTKSFSDQTVLCSNATYGKDPLTGVTKSCYVQAAIPVVMPPVVDHSGMGPRVDPALIPAAVAGYADARVRSTYRNSSTGADCTPGSPNCSVPPAFVLGGPSDIGAFRVSVGFAKMLYDDPIVFPGQPGVSHLHTYTGNAAIDAFTTTSSIVTGNSTSDGGTLNRSSYWFPTMVDTGNGQPLVPTNNAVYYKGSYEFDISSVVQPLPTGLRMVSGNAKNTDPAKTGARYICLGPNGENPGWKNTITAAYADGTCKVGGDFLMEVPFPMCWDGVNLDSPNHASHMSFAAQDQTPPFAKHCPTTHPVVLPVISYNIHYTITDNTAVSRWRLSSDMDPTLPAGISGHADYFLGWDATTMNKWLTNCIKAKMDCHADLLGGDQVLY